MFVGVPDICPFDVLKLRPLGNAVLSAYVKYPVPPVAVTGVNALAAIPLVKVVLGIACTITICAGKTLSENVPLTDWPAESVTVIVYIVFALDTVAVPDMAPLDVLKLSPLGNGVLILYNKGLTPPVTLIGVNVTAATFCVNSLLGTFSVNTNAGGFDTVKLNVLVAV